jgi:hypothetical protein
MTPNDALDLVLIPVKTSAQVNLPELASGCSSCTSAVSTPRDSEK